VLCRVVAVESKEVIFMFFDGPLNAVVNGFGVSECERIFDTVVE